MMRWIVLAVVALGIAALIGQRYTDAEAEPIRIPYRDSAVVDRGEVLYKENCASCHGDKLEGQSNWRSRGPDGRLPAPPHNETGHTWHHPDPQLFQVTKYGTAKVAPPGYETDMAGYAEILSDDDILAVLAYIKSAWPADIQARHDRMNARAQ